MAKQSFKIYAFLCLCLTVLILQVQCEDDSQKNFAVELSAENFNENVQKNNHFVMFFAPWCGHCKRLHPLWEQLAELMNVKEDPNVVIGKVDCTQQQELCNKHEVTGYPTLRFFKVGANGSVKFKGARDMPAITEFINQQLHDDEENEISKDEDDSIPAPQKLGQLVELTEENFAKHVSSGKHFVKFYAPWCSHCQRLAPTWDELAKELQAYETVSIAKIDCTVYRPICQDFEVKGYPTLLWIEDGKKIEKYSGKRDLEFLKEYVIKQLGAEVAPPVAKDDEVPTNEDDKKEVKQLIGDDFKATVATGVTFVKFYAPWCSHCQKLSPTWDELAEKMHGGEANIKIAKVDCTHQDNKNICVAQEVEGYPTLFAYKNGEKQSEYHGSRSLPELQQYISKIVGHDEL